MSLRSVLAAVFVLCALPASADTRTFLVDGSDDYGIDRCLASGEQCGTAAASALCRARDYAKAVDFGRIDRAEITGGLPGGIQVKACDGQTCPLVVAITCSR
ncbi:MAG TPA: hypothetical protein VHI75_02805 [Casimicrobiaceae bacterium]|nr:hypothetical protein [Casimicrobiaceae bacterium]